MAHFQFDDRVILTGRPNLYGSVESVNGGMVEVAWDGVTRTKRDGGRTGGSFTRRQGTTEWVAASRLTNKTRRSAEKPTGAGHCSVCRGPHVYKHGRP